MLNTKKLLNQIKNEKSNKPVFVVAMVNGIPARSFGLTRSSTAELELNGEKIRKASLLLTTTPEDEYEIETQFRVSTLKKSIKESKERGYMDVHLLVDEMDAIAQLRRVDIWDDHVTLIIDWVDLLTNDVESREFI
jgi:hypothetical protein